LKNLSAVILFKDPTVALKMLSGSRLLNSTSLIWVIKKLRKKVIDKTGRQKVQNPKNSKLK
jgi:hypothetical protein